MGFSEDLFRILQMSPLFLLLPTQPHKIYSNFTQNLLFATFYKPFHYTSIYIKNINNIFFY